MQRKSINLVVDNTTLINVKRRIKMNREYLEGLGLEKDAIDKVMSEYGKSINATKQNLESVTTERDDLKAQIVDRDTQLNDLSGKVKDSDELTTEINRLKQVNEESTSELQTKLDKQAFDFTLEKALSGANVRNPKAVKGLLDMDKIKLDGDTLLNFDDQIKGLQESDDYLFNPVVEDKPPSVRGARPTESNQDNQGNVDPFAAKLAKYE